MFSVIAAVSRLVFHKAERIAAIIKYHVALLPILPNTSGNAGHFLTNYFQAGTGNSAPISDRPQPLILFLYPLQHLHTRQMILNVKWQLQAWKTSKIQEKKTVAFGYAVFLWISVGRVLLATQTDSKICALFMQNALYFSITHEL